MIRASVSDWYDPAGGFRLREGHSAGLVFFLALWRGFRYNGERPGDSPRGGPVPMNR